MSDGPINLVINGRGPQGPAAIGVFQVMEEKELTRLVKRVGGASVGAMLGLLFAIGWTNDQIKNLAGELMQFLDKSDNPIRNINRFLHKQGYYKGKRLHEWAQDVIAKALGNPNATFIDLHNKVLEVRKEGWQEGDPRCDVFMQVSNHDDKLTFERFL